MEHYTIITENDESKWEDIPGMQYHFPNRYLKFLTKGTKVIYYKGKIKNKKYRSLRLSDEPHYFGLAEIGELSKEKNSNNHYAIINNFKLFKKAIPFKNNQTFLESIPASRVGNYWRDGVRPINEAIYKKIIKLSDVEFNNSSFNDGESDDKTSIEMDGGRKKIYTTVYERNKTLRDRAIKIHGYTCMVCEFNFKDIYGDWGEGYIHVHHIKPISSFKEKVQVDPKKDLVVVCANCHSMIHRRRDKVLTIQELKLLYDS